MQDDLRQLKKNLVRMTVQQNGEVLDIQALDTAISRTENGIRVNKSRLYDKLTRIYLYS